MKLASFLASAALRQVEIAAHRGLRALMPSLRDVALGVACLVLCAVVLGLTFVFLALIIFFYLAAAEGSWFGAAVWMTVGGLVISLLLLGGGLSLLRVRKKT